MSKSIDSYIEKDICIIGGGAAGMMAAICACDCSKKISVSIIEHNDRLGKKILSTGNGKCNLGNMCLSSDAYHGSFDKTFLDTAFLMFGVDQTISFFNSLGLYIRNKDGYLYPYSETASAVLDVLRFACHERNVSVYDNFEIVNVNKNDDKQFVISSKDIKIIAKKLIISTGGKSAYKTGSDGSGYAYAKTFGHKINKTVPALLKVKSDSPYCKMLDGVRAKGNVELYIDNKKTGISDYGEIQFTKEGLSGIPVFNISREIYYAFESNKQITLKLDLMPEYSEEIICADINKLISKYKQLTVEETFSGLLNKKILLVVFKICGIKSDIPSKNMNSSMVDAFVHVIKNMRFNISSGYDFDISQVTAGGVDFNEIDNNLMSKLVDNLYFAGEILDIDGRCGGYNLQWAWTSGYIAGSNAAKSL